MKAYGQPKNWNRRKTLFWEKSSVTLKSIFNEVEEKARDVFK